MRLAALACCGSILLAACGGGGGAPAAQPSTLPGPSPTPSAGVQSAGGIWHAFTTVPSDTVTLYVAEDGNMRLIDAGPAFGTGAIVVNGVDDLSGSYQVRGIQPVPSLPPGVSRDCTLDGKVVQRASLQVTVRCTDSAGAATELSRTFVYDSAYDLPSSLDAISGNYTLQFAPQTNSLTIAKDGTVFGAFHNGQQCTVNGRVDLTDARFNLYRVGFTFSSCQVFQQFEGQTLTGFATRSTLSMAANSFYLLITGVINGRLEFVSVLYQPP